MLNRVRPYTEGDITLEIKNFDINYPLNIRSLTKFFINSKNYEKAKIRFEKIKEVDCAMIFQKEEYFCTTLDKDYKGVVCDIFLHYNKVGYFCFPIKKDFDEKEMKKILRHLYKKFKISIQSIFQALELSLKEPQRVKVYQKSFDGAFIPYEKRKSFEDLK